ncbi:MAG: ATP-binding cassette domain-containing protein, partial [Bacteriovoracia bacterium]
AERNPKKLVDAQGIAKSYGGRVIVPKIDLLITPQSRVGLLGPNGCGKSTLIRMLIGSENSDGGTIARSDQLTVSYFEQNRESLDPQTSVLKTICPNGDHVDYRGTRVHVRSYLDRFLFTAGQAEMAVGKLSGGEQSRLLLARLMLTEANLLILDEPTNDLDMATLDVLQDVLQEYNGAVILVTHDRYFLDQVAKQILAFGVNEQGAKCIVPFEGLRQWEAWHDGQAARLAGPESRTAANVPSAQPGGAKKKKLSFKEQRELDGMEAAIGQAEAKVAALTAECADSQVATDSVRLNRVMADLAAAQGEVERLYARWSELSE